MAVITVTLEGHSTQRRARGTARSRTNFSCDGFFRRLPGSVLRLPYSSDDKFDHLFPVNRYLWKYAEIIKIANKVLEQPGPNKP